MKKRFAELFAGVGGFRVGLDRLHSGWDCVYANQYEPERKRQYAYECYQEHFGESEYVSNEDINTVDKSSIPDMELLVGGFPCQDYSVAHSGAQGIQGKKGVLWWAIRDTIEAKEPPFVLLENVDRLLTSPGKEQRGRDFGMILYTLDQLGYGVKWRAINAAEYGFPQKRRRVFLFAYRHDTTYFKRLERKDSLMSALAHDDIDETLPIDYDVDKGTTISLDGYKDMVDFSDHFHADFKRTGIMQDHHVYTVPYSAEYAYHGPITTLGDILLDRPVDDDLFIDQDKIDKFAYLKGSKKRPRTSANGHRYYFSEGSMPFPDRLDRPGRTMLTAEHSTNRTTHVVKDRTTGRLRLLDPIECERMQGFPDDWTAGMPKSSRYFMMGNALVCGLVTRLGRKIDEIIDQEK